MDNTKYYDGENCGLFTYKLLINEIKSKEKKSNSSLFRSVPITCTEFIFFSFVISFDLKHLVEERLAVSFCNGVEEDAGAYGISWWFGVSCHAMADDSADVLHFQPHEVKGHFYC